MPRVFTFRGRSVEDLQKMSIAEFEKLLPSRQRRAIARQGLRYKELQEKVEKVCRHCGGTKLDKVFSTIHVSSGSGDIDAGKCRSMCGQPGPCGPNRPKMA